MKLSVTPDQPKKEFQESQRRNKTMESIAMDARMFLATYKKVISFFSKNIPQLIMKERHHGYKKNYSR